MGDKTLYDATVASSGSLANAHENILRMRRNGVFENITGDINNLNPIPTAATAAREAYGNKGVEDSNKINDSWVITFDVELVRTSSGELVPAQAWLVDLYGIANAVGEANKAEFQWFDALAGALPAHEGKFRVSIAPSTTGYADKNVQTVTLTGSGPAETITSPIAGDGSPVLESALPADAEEGDLLYVRGVFLEDVSAATIGGTAATAIHEAPGDPYLVILEVPAGAAGAAPIVVTTSKGASDPLPYTRGD